MDFSELLHGFVKIDTWICLSYYVDLSKLFYIFLPLCQTKPSWSFISGKINNFLKSSCDKDSKQKITDRQWCSRSGNIDTAADRRDLWCLFRRGAITASSSTHQCNITNNTFLTNKQHHKRLQHTILLQQQKCNILWHQLVQYYNDGFKFDFQSTGPEALAANYLYFCVFL